jgi:hypothetical protein
MRPPTLDVAAAPGSGSIAIGTTVAADGTILFAGLTTGVFAFAPAG